MLYPYNLYMIDNELYAHHSFRHNVADNGAQGEALAGLCVSPGGMKGDPEPLIVVWQWTNGDPTLVATAPAGYRSYGEPVGLGVSNTFDPEWLQQYGAPAGEEIEWLSDAVYAALNDSNHPGFDAFRA